MPIKTVHEKARGCGYRKKGGLYLRFDGVPFNCGLLPITLDTCPCCGAGVKASRGFQWVKRQLLGSDPCKKETCGNCGILNLPMDERMGLIWIGERFYKSPKDFIKEASEMGISRRLTQIPRGFEVGKTWVLLGHRKGNVKQDSEGVVFDEEGNPEFLKQVFAAFIPSRIEYVVNGDETQEEIERLEARGLTLVDVVKI